MAGTHDCTHCGDPTDAAYRICRPCLRADVARERTAQGLPPTLSDAQHDQIATILRGHRKNAA